MAVPNKVYLVGAGPGDPGLITVKGARLLEQADVVVYDFLANARLLEHAPEGSERIYVGKRAGYHSTPQEKITELLIDYWKKGKNVVRLKGGDPFVFGRGGEEALALAEEGIPFEVVPAGTAGLAGLAYAGIPATHRGLAVCTTLVTGHEDPTKESSDLDWRALATHGGTIVVYMGVHNLPVITKELQAGGLPPETPAALVRMASFPEQRVLVSTLGEIDAEAKRDGITPPALLCVGHVVSLRDKLNWFETRPLFGKRVVITRPREQSGRQRDVLEALGAEAIEEPAIEILPPIDFAQLDHAIEQAARFDFVIFTSVNGVKYFFERLRHLGLDARALAGTMVCAIGPGTTKAIEAHGIRPDLIPEQYTSASLVPALIKKYPDLKGKKALLPRADIAPGELIEALKMQGLSIEEVTAYRTVAAQNNDDRSIREAFESGRVDAVTFASSSAAQNFLNRLGSGFLKKHKGKAAFVSIGPVTTKTMTQAGFPPDCESREHTIPGLADALVDFFDNKVD
ncbi:MAG: uroporphyrinogen-III C-methyltransferase [Planctomycetes bacterium]|nr:uroporphyrinogen-III C-methyltransferase [Planctomycetota bacterium]